MNKPLSIEMKQFYAELNSGIGGSSVPTIIGDPAALKYNSPFKMYQTYVGDLERTEPERFGPAWMGKFQEPALLELLKLDTGMIVTEPFELNVDPILQFETTMLRDDEFPFAICHLDGWAWSKASDKDDLISCKQNSRDRCIVEAKNLGEYKAKEFGEPFTDEIPDAIVYQCQHNLKVARSYAAKHGMPLPIKALVPVIIGGNKYRTYVVDWHEELWSRLLPIESEFWQRVTDKNPPPVDGSTATSEFIKLKYKAAEPKTTIELPDDMLKLVNQYIKADRLIKETRDIKAGCENNLKDFLGSHEILTWQADPIFSWGNTKGKTSWKGVAGDLMDAFATLQGWDKKQAAEHLELLKLNYEGEPGRQFRAKDKYLALIGEGDDEYE